MSITASFETGTNGNNIATTDTGNATAWDTVSIGASGTAKYDNTHVNSGSLAAKIQTAGAAVTLQWTGAFGTQTDHYGRVYFYFTAAPTSNIQLIRVQSGSTAQAFVTYLSSGKLRSTDVAAATATTTNSVALNQQVRVEYRVFHNASTGIIELKLFNTATSTTPTETLTFSSANTGASSDRIRFGNVATTTEGPFWMDNIVAAATSYPGPLSTGLNLLATMGVG
jgi:hypothetical protein